MSPTRAESTQSYVSVVGAGFEGLDAAQVP
jgi:hypothetical protein